MLPTEWAALQRNKKVRVVLRTGKVFTGTLSFYNPQTYILMEDMELWNEKEFIGKAMLSIATVAYIERLK